MTDRKFTQEMLDEDIQAARIADQDILLHRGTQIKRDGPYYLIETEVECMMIRKEDGTWGWGSDLNEPAKALDYRSLIEGEKVSEPMDGVVRPLSKMKTFKVTR